MLSRIEKQLKRRFAIGSQVSEHSIVQDFTKQVSLPNPGSASQAEDTEGILLVLLVWFPLSHHLVFCAQQRGAGMGCLSHRVRRTRTRGVSLAAHWGEGY